MVQLAFASILIALVAALAVSAAPFAGTYVLTHARTGWNLTLGSEEAYPILYAQESGSDRLSQEWLLDRNSDQKTVSFKSAKVGLYLGYESAEENTMVTTKNEPTGFKLVRGSDKKTVNIATAGKDSSKGLVLDIPQHAAVDEYSGVSGLFLVPRGSNTRGAWVITRREVPKSSKPQQVAGSTKCGTAAPESAWVWPSN
ncbi:hypothetical protein FRC12_021656 [Ceratobasidium sp. 428]|nr:hypothetical protein FRC12_021656 [Ceratobasidium sp. 428]